MINEENVKDSICKTINNWFVEHPKESSASLARKLNVSDTSVKRWRNGICLPDTTILPELCEIMNISLLTLFGIDNTKGLTSTEQRVVREIQTNSDFKSFIEKYLNDKDYQNLINSITKFQK